MIASNTPLLLKRVCELTVCLCVVLNTLNLTWEGEPTTLPPGGLGSELSHPLWPLQVSTTISYLVRYEPGFYCGRTTCNTTPASHLDDSLDGGMAGLFLEGMGRPHCLPFGLVQCFCILACSVYMCAQTWHSVQFVWCTLCILIFFRNQQHSRDCGFGNWERAN